MSWPEFLAAITPALIALLGAGAAYLKARSAHQRIDQQQDTGKKT